MLRDPQRLEAAFLLLLPILNQDLAAQDNKAPMPESLFDTLQWRSVGPARGGRSNRDPTIRMKWWFGPSRYPAGSSRPWASTR